MAIVRIKYVSNTEEILKYINVKTDVYGKNKDSFFILFVFLRMAGVS